MGILFPLFYFNKIKEVIRTDKELDLPTQKQMLAMYRCDEIAKVSMNYFLGKIKEFKQTITEENKICEGFGAKSGNVLKETISSFY